MLHPETFRRAGIVQLDIAHQHLAGSFRPLAGMVLSDFGQLRAVLDDVGSTSEVA